MKVLKCGKLFDAASGEVLSNMAVCVEQNKVTAVKPYNEVKEDGVEIIDLSNKFVMPGLIDTHVHVMLNGTANSWSQASTEMLEGDVAFACYNNAKKDLMAGFTTLRDEGCVYFADVALRDAINSGKMVGPRMMVSGECITATGGHADDRLAPGVGNPLNAIASDGPNATRKQARYNFKYGADQIKIMATGGVMSLGDDPNASEFTYEEFKAAIDVAKEVGKLSSAHAHGANGIKLAIKAGIDTIEHGMLIDDEGMDLLVEHGVWLVTTIIAAKNIALCPKGMLPDWMIEKAKLVLENHKLHMNKLRSMGAKIAFGSDAGTCFNYHGQQTAEFENLVEFGFTPVETLQLATVKAAEMMRWGDRVGQLKEGYFADVVAYDNNPLEDMSVMNNCTFVMKDGTVYKG